MSEAHGLTAENLLRTLPPALARDETMRSLAAAIAGLLAAQPAEIERLALYPRIERLDGPLLDILAHDFKVDWWDSDYSTAEKRRTLAASWQVHKTLGTRAAVEKAASAVYPNTRVQEWFEYGGEPYRFKLDVGLGEFEWDRERHKRLMWGLGYYKNLRSHLEAVEYHVPPVEVENWQAFCFTALSLLAGLGNRPGGLGVGRLLLPYQALTGTAAALSGLVVSACQRQQQSFSAGGFYRAREPNLQKLGFQKINIMSKIITQETVGASVTSSNLDWRFNSQHKFNGQKKFNGGIKRSEL